MTEWWFPICEHCDEDAVSFAPPAENTWWRFACPRHQRIGFRSIRDVHRGWRPEVQDSAWNAALAAIRGVQKPTDEELSFWATSARTTPRPFVAPRPPVRPENGTPAWTPHDAIPAIPTPGHWADGTPIDYEEPPPEEDW